MATYEIGAQVMVTNTNGVEIPGVKTITGTETWPGYAELRYFYAPSDSPWFSVEGECLRPAEPVGG